tara:strand:+ start:1581 stop:1856 length:276 start_codon:yes stop_codon:yes gene_type:complete
MTEELDILRPLRIAAKAADAYSADAWGPVLWVQATQMLCSLDFTDDEVEGLLRSKLTRWARDAYGVPETYLGQLFYLVREAQRASRINFYL